MFFKETGRGVSLQHLSSAGAAEAIQLRNVVDLAVQVLNTHYTLHTSHYTLCTTH